MHVRRIAAASRGVLIATAFTLVAGAALGWMGFRALLERERSVQTHYTATTVLVRDRLVAELARLESELAGNLDRAAQTLADSTAARNWLSRLGEDQPWISQPALLRHDGAILSGGLQAGWSRREPEAPADARFVSVIREAERLEFAKNDLEGALRVYRATNRLARSISDRVVGHMRAGRVFYKLGRYGPGIEQYQAAAALSGDLADSNGVPYAAGALREIVDGFAALRLPAERRGAERQLRDYVVSHPWDVAAGYEYHLARARSLGGDVRPAGDPGIGQLEAQLARLRWMQRDLAPRVFGQPRGETSGAASSRIAVGGEADGADVRWVGPTRTDGGGVALAYELRRSYVAGPLLDRVLGTVDLGRDQLVSVLDRAAQGRGAASAPVTLAEAALGGTPGWRVGLFDRRGRSIQQLAARERAIYGTLIAGTLVVLIAGVAFTARASARTAQLARLRTEFVTSVSHELKTPLALIRMYGETLDSGIVENDAQRSEFYGVIRRESERLTHLIDNMLDAARIEAGTKQYSLETADLGSIARAALDAYRPFFERQGFTVEAALPDRPFPVQADRDGVIRALINLFQNAIKYCVDDRHVAVSASSAGGEYRLSVADRGIGLAAAEIPRIFDKYYRVRGEGSTAAAGSGLGLSLVRHTMTAHGGRVEVESAPGAGSVFTLVFPAARGTSDGAPS